MTSKISVWKVPSPPDKKALAKTNAMLLAQTGDYKIRNEETFIAAWSLVQRHDEMIRKIEEKFDPFIAGLHNLHKMAISMRDEFLKPVLLSKKALLGKRALYRALMETEKQKRDAAAAALLQQQQKKELERQARIAEKTGDKEAAEVLREQKEVLPLPYLDTAPAVPRQEGSIVRKRWVYAIIDAAAVEREYCSPDNKKIRPIVEAMGPACKISGLQIWEDEQEHSRSVPE